MNVGSLPIGNIVPSVPEVSRGLYHLATVCIFNSEHFTRHFRLKHIQYQF